MSSNPDMRRNFANREELIAYLREQFPDPANRDDQISHILGGHQAAKTTLDQVQPAQYGKTRNFLTGKVTQLSPYIRYGVLSLAEVRDAVLDQVEDQHEAQKLLQELAWRDYWQRLYAQLGDRIWDDQEPYKTGCAAQDYASNLPDEIDRGNTGMVCIDSFTQQLHATGYLHNHARMWLAAYIVHWRKIKWQAGAKWFLQHLLDGDPASNNLSWQWVASTFSHKPYFFNRENLERFTEGVYCRQCPLYGDCDFEGSYEDIEKRLFPHGEINRDRGSQNWQHPKSQKRQN